MADLRTIQNRSNTQRNMATRFDDDIEEIEEIDGGNEDAFNDPPIYTRRKINSIEDNIAPRIA